MAKTLDDRNEFQAALDRLRAHLRERGLRQTQQRETIARVVLQERRHLSVEEIYLKAQEFDPRIGHSTIYRTLKILTDADIVHEHHFNDGVTRFEFTNPATHHDHIICTGCRTIVEFECIEIEDLQDQIAETHGFRLSHHTHELYGLCTSCQSETS